VSAASEAFVASRFDALHERFKPSLPLDDPRLGAIIAKLRQFDARAQFRAGDPPAVRLRRSEPTILPARASAPADRPPRIAKAQLQGLRVLDLGCGKGRFGRALAEGGAEVIGLDISAGMLAAARGMDRVQASVRRLPFAGSTFDAALAVEVLEHVETRLLDGVLAEARRVLRPGGKFLIIDKNLYSWNAQRTWLPSVALKWIDQYRGLWMYSPGDPVRERWFRAGGLKRRLRCFFCDVQVIHLSSRAEEGRFPFKHLPGTRLFAMWVAEAPKEVA
jgi:2-polyprenyl-6-hydroxyphenyl methylase/3-demethylubiquinone-9 3-methyltransferase